MMRVEKKEKGMLVWKTLESLQTSVLTPWQVGLQNPQAGVFGKVAWVLGEVRVKVFVAMCWWAPPGTMTNLDVNALVERTGPLRQG